MSLTKARELAVLSALAAHDMHGYAIATELGGSVGRLLGIKRSNVYAMLERFAAQGWVGGRKESAGAYPDREVYALTASGRKAMDKLAAELTRGDTMPIAPLLAVLLHGQVSDMALARSALIAEREAFLAELEALAAGGHEHNPAVELARDLVTAELRTLGISR